MKLLICTQIVDKQEPTLGFFHEWIRHLAKRAETTNVICLQEGEHDLPTSIGIHSLGKEHASGSRIQKRIRYITRLFHYVWVLRNEYDVVFVHMNQEYILLCGLLWRMMGKKVFLWRNHYDGSVLTDVAASLCDEVFCTSRYSYTAKYKKTRIMPVGVDVASVAGLPEVERIPRSILSIGRISPSKNIHMLIEALGKVYARGISFTADIIGKTDDKDAAYGEKLRARATELGLGNLVHFHDAVPKTETYKAYRSHEISVNTSPSGMLDKTMFSGMMHGCLILVSNKDLIGSIPKECLFEEGDIEGLTEGLVALLAMSSEEKEKRVEALKTFVQAHSIDTLVSKLFAEFEGK